MFLSLVINYFFPKFTKYVTNVFNNTFKMNSAKKYISRCQTKSESNITILQKRNVVFNFHKINIGFVLFSK